MAPEDSRADPVPVRRGSFSIVLPATATMSLAVTVSLAGGLLQNSARLFGKLALGTPLDHGVHAWWMTPLGDAMLLVPLGILLALAGTRVPMARRAGVQGTILGFPVLLTLLMLAPRIHPAAQMLLAAGIAAQLGLWASRMDVPRWLPATTKSLVALTAIIAVPMALWPTGREALDRHGLSAARDGAPNVLLLVWDTARAASLDLYGYGTVTAPGLTRLAADGVVFDRAFATASYTLPSHASLFTGHWAHELSSDWRVPLDREPITLAEVLKSAGYRTGGFSANRHYVTREYGLGRGFMHFEEYRVGFQQVVRSSTLLRVLATSRFARDVFSFDDDLARVHAEDHHRALLQWVERDRSRPYFAFVNFMEAHTPYLPRPEYAKRFGWYSDSTSPAERRQVQLMTRIGPEDLPREQALRTQRAYDASLAQLDDAMTSMLADLRAHGLLENTLVIVTADHGEEFGEHGIFGHGNSLYPPSIHVPLVMVQSGRIPSAQRVAATVSIRDIPATILDLVGVKSTLPGESLRALWESPGTVRTSPALSELRYNRRLPARSLASKGDMASIVDETMQVIRIGEGNYEAFDLSADAMGTVRADTLTDHFRSLRASLPSLPRAAALRDTSKSLARR